MKFIFGSSIIHSSSVTSLPLKAVQVLFTPMVAGWVGRWVVGGQIVTGNNNLVAAVSQKS